MVGQFILFLACFRRSDYGDGRRARYDQENPVRGGVGVKNWLCFSVLTNLVT